MFLFERLSEKIQMIERPFLALNKLLTPTNYLPLWHYLVFIRIAGKSREVLTEEVVIKSTYHEWK
jgi:hypothetical protein